MVFQTDKVNSKSSQRVAFNIGVSVRVLANGLSAQARVHVEIQFPQPTSKLSPPHSSSSRNAGHVDTVESPRHGTPISHPELVSIQHERHQNSASLITGVRTDKKYDRTKIADDGVLHC